MSCHSFVAYFVLIYMSPKSPPSNASKSISIFENGYLVVT